MSEKKAVDKKNIKDLLAEKDAFLTTSEKIQEYFFRHTKGAIICLAAVALIIIGAAIYSNHKEKTEEKAAMAHENALQMLEASQDVKSVIEALQKVRSEYSGYKAARMAGYSLVALYNSEESYDQALAIMEELLRTLPQTEISLKPILLNNIGELYEVKKNYDLAAKSYEAILTNKEVVPGFRQSVLLALGRVNSAAGKKDEAIKWYETIIKEYPSGLATYMANTKLAELKGQPIALPIVATGPEINVAQLSSSGAAAENEITALPSEDVVFFQVGDEPEKTEVSADSSVASADGERTE